MNREISKPPDLREQGIKHPFRRRLPVKLVQIAREEHESEKAALAKEKGLGDDASLFLLSFLAFFTAFYTFIF